MAKIKNIQARQINDSRGNPTVEVILETAQGEFIASCPSGASTGKNEAVALSVKEAIENVNKIIAPKLKGSNPTEQEDIDELMIKLDGTPDKSKLGANAILPVSIAVCRAGAADQKLPLYQNIAKLSEVGSHSSHSIPVACFNFIEGGAHAVGKNKLDLQEFMVVPQKKSFKENLILANQIFQNLQKLIAENFGSAEVFGDEGGFAPLIEKAEQALLLLKNATDKTDTKIIIDAAASQFYTNGKYELEGHSSTRPGLVEFYGELIERFPIIAIEDPFAEDDWQGFQDIVRQLSETIIIGDDLTTTNIKRIKEAHSKNACNGVIIKPNQIGTVTETIEAVKLAKSYGWKIIVSHRSGETMDNFIADLAVGCGADFIKSGSPSQEERMVKYQRLIDIEGELKKQ